MTKILFALGVNLFFLFVLVLELRTGIAVNGWPGNFEAVERKKYPGSYWFAITLHVLMWIGIPLLIWFQV